MHEPIFIPATRKLHELFNLLKAEKLNISIILDEYGGLAGIVTREDIIEEILGDLYDENEDQGIERIQKTGPKTWRVMGDTSHAPVYPTPSNFNCLKPNTPKP